MKILKYKKGVNGKYKVTLENNLEMNLYEEVILKYELLLHKEITEEKMIEIEKSNQEWDVYYVALKSLKSRIKSTKELKEILLRKEYPKELIDQAIEKLTKQGYLNDRVYARSYINTQMLTSSKGPFRIIKDLEEKKIDSNIIEEEIQVFTEEEQEERIKKIIEKLLRTNHNKGGMILKQKINNDLKNYGYDISLIHQILSRYSFTNNEQLAKKEYEKLMTKYSRKYEGEELQRIVKDKLYRKGLQYEEE